jgi:hypothetical protein
MAEGARLQVGRDEGREAPHGLEPAEVLRRSDTQKLTSIDESGVREELVRVPVGLLIEEPEG